MVVVVESEVPMGYSKGFSPFLLFIAFVQVAGYLIYRNDKVPLFGAWWKWFVLPPLTMILIEELVKANRSSNGVVGQLFEWGIPLYLVGYGIWTGFKKEE